MCLFDMRLFMFVMMLQGFTFIFTVCVISVNLQYTMHTLVCCVGAGCTIYSYLAARRLSG